MIDAVTRAQMLVRPDAVHWLQRENGDIELRLYVADVGLIWNFAAGRWEPSPIESMVMGDGYRLRFTRTQAQAWSDALNHDLAIREQLRRFKAVT
jgi:hypothetical protein